MRLARRTNSGGRRPCIRVKGCYQRMLDSDEDIYMRVDPRLTIGMDLTAEQLAALQDQRQWAKPSGRYGALLAGEPVVVNAWFALPGNVYRGVRQSILRIETGTAVTVYPDDVIELADPRDRIVSGRAS
jgi:hypothetical protein